MKLVTVKMPETYVEGLDELVRMGRYSSRSEAIRVAVRELLKRELWGMGILEGGEMQALQEGSPPVSVGIKRVVVQS